LTTLISFFADLVLPVTVGFLLRRAPGIKARTIDRMMLVQLFVLLPIATALSFWVVSLDTALIWLPLIGVLMILLPGAVGFSYFRSRFQDPLEQGSFLLSVMLANRGVVGAISLFILFGETGYAYAQLTMMLAAPVLYLICFPMAQYFGQAGKQEKEYRVSFRSLFFHPRQLPLLGILVGLALNLSELPRPKPLGAALPFLIHLGAWLFLVPVGHSFDPIRIRHYIFKIWDVLAIRHVLTPALLAFLGYLIGYRGTVLACIVVLAGCPVAINAVVVSKLFSLKPDLASSGFILSTSIYLVFLFPMYYLFATHLFF
jgi:hypothetical protein